jgi:hypothetical protein
MHTELSGTEETTLTSSRARLGSRTFATEKSLTLYPHSHLPFAPQNCGLLKSPAYIPNDKYDQLQITG